MSGERRVSAAMGMAHGGGVKAAERPHKEKAIYREEGREGGREGERDEGIDSLSRDRPTAMVLLAAGE